MLTPGGEGERTVVRLAAALRDPQIAGWLARVRARRALRRLCGQLLEHLDALSPTSADRPGPTAARGRERPSGRAADGRDTSAVHAGVASASAGREVAPRHGTRSAEGGRGPFRRLGRRVITTMRRRGESQGAAPTFR